MWVGCREHRKCYRLEWRYRSSRFVNNKKINLEDRRIIILNRVFGLRSKLGFRAVVWAKGFTNGCCFAFL